MSDSAGPMNENPTPVSGGPRRLTPRQRMLGALGGVVVLGGLIWGGYYLLVGAHEISTDDAYVGADVAEITPLVSGQVIAVPVVETQRVKAGQVVLRLDPADAQIAVDQARADLAQTERRVRGYFATDQALAAQVAARKATIAQAEANVLAAQSDLERAQIDLTRRQALAKSGAVSGDELTSAQNRFATAKAALAAARAAKAAAAATLGQASGDRAVNAALIAGEDVDHNPDVMAAKAKLAAAELFLSRTVITAPMDGVVTKKAVEIGQQVSPGAVAMQIVPLSTLYVDANYKEVQLNRVRPGQSVTLTSDLYGDGVKFHGRVRGLSGGTGTAFSLIPAQNASGNWIKIVQRLPVRITLDPRELAAHPLRVGLSMKATIDVSGHGQGSAQTSSQAGAS
ncbi:MAG: HlyD family efflux transporter periplasmic adaptor subunit [Alphaproteobacteria bacterium]|nr:HlyD family efflux transporter periplasmic adaptor subunit [Alphaproteobacteria bacterium]